MGGRHPCRGHLPMARPASVRQDEAQVGITMDLTATILAATHTPVPANAKLEGIDLLPILGAQSPPIERTLFWRINSVDRQQKAVRKGEWKLLQDGDDLLLFHLRTDIGERNDLARQRPDLVAKLLPLITRWEKDVDAEAKPTIKGLTPSSPAPQAMEAVSKRSR